MTSQGSAHGRITRAVKNRNLLNAETAARELGELSVPDALAFCLLLADVDDGPEEKLLFYCPECAGRVRLSRMTSARDAATRRQTAKRLASLRYGPRLET
jgi:hypothetical protein